MKTVEIAPLCESEVERVGALAREIWHAHYPGIISVAQIDYMLAERYDPAVMRAELLRDDTWWDVLKLNGAPVAFASYGLAGDGREMKLDKLYVHPGQQRRGYGGMLISRVCDVARARGCVTVALAVNKRNQTAVAAYRKHGFAVREAVVKDIGGGFVMDDYIMVRSIKGEARRTRCSE